MRKEKIDHPCVPIYDIGETVYIFVYDEGTMDSFIQECVVEKIAITVSHDDIRTKYTVIDNHGNSWIKAEPAVFKSPDDLIKTEIQKIKELTVNI